MDGDYQHKKEARAISYLKNAVIDLETVKSLMDANKFDQVLFHCQQCCEKSMKACLALYGILLAEEHYNISNYFKSQIIPKTKHELKLNLKKIIGKIEEIEWYYIPTRYPVTREGDVYLTEFTEKRAKEVLNITEEFLNLCFEFIENLLNERLAKEKKLRVEELKQKRLDIKLPKTKEGLIEYLKKNYSDVIKEKID